MPHARQIWIWVCPWCATRIIGEHWPDGVEYESLRVAVNQHFLDDHGTPNWGGGRLLTWTVLYPPHERRNGG